MKTCSFLKEIRQGSNNQNKMSQRKANSTSQLAKVLSRIIQCKILASQMLTFSTQINKLVSRKHLVLTRRMKFLPRIINQTNFTTAAMIKHIKLSSLRSQPVAVTRSYLLRNDELMPLYVRQFQQLKLTSQIGPSCRDPLFHQTSIQIKAFNLFRSNHLQRLAILNSKNQASIPTENTSQGLSMKSRNCRGCLRQTFTESKVTISVSRLTQLMTAIKVAIQ